MYEGAQCSVINVNETLPPLLPLGRFYPDQLRVARKYLIRGQQAGGKCDGLCHQQLVERILMVVCKCSHAACVLPRDGQSLKPDIPRGSADRLRLRPKIFAAQRRLDGNFQDADRAEGDGVQLGLQRLPGGRRKPRRGVDRPEQVVGVEQDPQLLSLEERQHIVR